MTIRFNPPIRELPQDLKDKKAILLAKLEEYKGKNTFLFYAWNSNIMCWQEDVKYEFPNICPQAIPINIRLSTQEGSLSPNNSTGHLSLEVKVGHRLEFGTKVLLPLNISDLDLIQALENLLQVIEDGHTAVLVKFENEMVAELV